MTEDLYKKTVNTLFGYIYEGKPIELTDLSEEEIEDIKGYRPRLPADEFPEDFPDEENGYDGTYFTLYRGLCFRTKEAYDLFMEAIKYGMLETEGISSWSRSDGVAERFAFGAGLLDKPASVYCGVILETTPVHLEETFFASYLAHSEIQFELKEKLETIENQKQHSMHEDEIVLLPGKYQVTVYKTIK